eukprot:scaffold6774_cov19-Tisochrysis_lutea.AAC.1
MKVLKRERLANSEGHISEKPSQLAPFYILESFLYTTMFNLRSGMEEFTLFPLPVQHVHADCPACNADFLHKWVTFLGGLVALSVVKLGFVIRNVTSLAASCIN